MTAGVKVRMSCIALVYRHALGLSPAQLGQATVGRVQNLMSTDCEKLRQVCHMAHASNGHPYPCDFSSAARHHTSMIHALALCAY